MLLKNFYQNSLYKEMCNEMGVQKHTFVEQHHCTVTNMLKELTQGSSTGMAHSRNTQEKTYDTLGQAAGIRNKFQANKALLKNTVLVEQVRFSHYILFSDFMKLKNCSRFF